MSGPHTHFIVVFFAFGLLGALPASAQYCIGRTAYIIRDEAGREMTVPEIEKLVVAVNGIELIWHRPDPKMDVILYQFEGVINYNKTLRRVVRNGGELRNPLGFGMDPPAFCGKIGDLVIRKGKKVMRLDFDIGEHNTHYEIDSLPFQEGTFRLKSTKCKDGTPPAIDNNTVGKCRVAASAWAPLDRSQKRIVIPRETWATGRSRKDCVGMGTEIITTEKRFAEVVRENPLMNQTYVPAVDFKTEIVLVQYLDSNRRKHGNGPLTVDARGDLTFGEPSAVSFGGGSVPFCAMRLWAVYRSGIATVEGKPIPPVSTRDLTPLSADPFRGGQ